MKVPSSTHRDEDGRTSTTSNAPNVDPTTLLAIAEKQRKKAKQAEKQAPHNGDDFPSKLGARLYSSGVDLLKEMTRKLDRNGDGMVEARAFSQHVHKLEIDADQSAIDAFWDELDDQHAGALEVRELKAALKALQERAAAREQQRELVHALAERYRQRAGLAESCAASAEMAEEAESKLAAMRETPSIQSKLGALLLKRCTKVSDLIAKWDEDGDGRLTRADFISHVRIYGLTEESASLDVLFDAFDREGTGLVDTNLLTRALRELQERAGRLNAEALAQAKSVCVLRRAFSTQHAALVQGMAKDEEECMRIGIGVAKKHAPSDRK